MNEHLAKAKNAIADATAIDVDLTAMTLPPIYSRLLDLAQVQAYVAIAELLDQILNGGINESVGHDQV